MSTSQTAADRPDFPFYDGHPVALAGRSWALVLLGVALGFLVLTFAAPSSSWRFFPAVLFPLIPLLALRAVAGPRTWSTLFHRPSFRDVLLALCVALLNIVVTIAIATAVSAYFGASTNPAIAELHGQSATGRLVFFAATIPQLLGEEILTIFPMLALLSWFSGPLGLPRRAALGLAWLLSALPFALAHLPTYDWNLPQCLLIIGSARLVLSLAYLRSRNLVVATMAHVFNDWLLFGGALALGGMGSSPA